MEDFDVKQRGLHQGTSAMQRAEINLDDLALIHFSRQSVWRINVMTTLNWITTHSQAVSGCTPSCLGRAPAEVGVNNAPAALSGDTFLRLSVCAHWFPLRMTFRTRKWRL